MESLYRFISFARPSSVCRSPVGSKSDPVVVRLTDIVLLLVWACFLPTVPPLWLVLVAVKVSHLRQLAILPLLLSETCRNEYQHCH